MLFNEFSMQNGKKGSIDLDSVVGFYPLVPDNTVVLLPGNQVTISTPYEEFLKIMREHQRRHVVQPH